MAEIIASPDNLSSYLWDIALGMSAGLLSFKVNGYPLSSGLLVIGLVASAGIFALDFVSLVSMGLRRMRITMRRLGTRVASLRMVIRMRRSPMETRDTKSSAKIPAEATSPITRSPDESGYPFTLKESKPADMPSAMSHK